MYSHKNRDTRKLAITPGELERTVAGQQPSIRTVIYSFVQGETGWALPVPSKRTPSRLLAWMFLLKPSETDSMRLSYNLCVCQRTQGICRSAIVTMFSSQMTGIKEPRDAVVEIVLPARSLSTTGLVFGLWCSGGDASLLPFSRYERSPPQGSSGVGPDVVGNVYKQAGAMHTSESYYELQWWNYTAWKDFDFLCDFYYSLREDFGY